MDQFAEQLTSFLALGTLLAEISIVIVIILFLTKKFPALIKFINKNAVLISFGISLFAVLMSLVYSNIIGFPACNLCWWQRIFLFPQAVLFTIALFKKDRSILDYTLLLSLVGASIGLFQYYGQMFQTSILPCETGPGAVSCALRYFVEYGHITIPFMSFVTFAMLITVGWIGRLKEIK